MLISWLSSCTSLFSAYFPRFYPSSDGISICLQLKEKFKDPLIIVKFFIMLKGTGMERLEVKLILRLKAMTALLSLEVHENFKENGVCSLVSMHRNNDFNLLFHHLKAYVEFIQLNLIAILKMFVYL